MNFSTGPSCNRPLWQDILLVAAPAIVAGVISPIVVFFLKKTEPSKPPEEKK